MTDNSFNEEILLPSIQSSKSIFLKNIIFAPGLKKGIARLQVNL